MNDSTNNSMDINGNTEADRVSPEVEELRKALDQANQSQDTWCRAHGRLHTYIIDTEEYLKEQYAGTMDEETRELIVEVLRRLGRETTKTVDVKITVTWTGSVEVPLDFDEYADDIVADNGWHEPELTIDGQQLDADLSIDDADVIIS